MKIVDVSQMKKQDTKPKMQDISHLMDAGLMQGFSIDVDQPTPMTAPTLSSSTANIPDTHLTNDTGGWTRQLFPSLGIPYNRTEPFWVRALDIESLAKVHAAQRTGASDHSKAFTMMIDALDPHIKDFDIRDLTAPDFYSFLYWLRLNSYTRSPFTVNWTSKYGNENVTRLTQSSFEFKELALTRTEYVEWRKRGIAFPTVRDLEALTTEDLEDSDRWKMTYAQYIYLEGPPTSDSMRLKVEKLAQLGPDAIPDINEFTELMTHGVVEQVKVRDAKFELLPALDYISNQVELVTGVLESALQQSDEGDTTGVQKFFHVHAHLEDLLRLQKDMKTAVETGSNYTPEEEVVTLEPANATTLFP